MFCRNCGARMANEDARFCSSCGAAANQTGGSAAPGARRPRQSRVWLYAIGIIGFILFTRIAVSILNQSTTKSAADSSVADASGATTEHHQIGEDVLIGYWAYRCDGAHWAKSIGYNVMTEYPDAEFLVVNLSILNNDNSASILPPLKLVDAQGREYEESSKSISLGDAFGVLKSVNPGVTSHGSVLFDVPPGDYSLRVSGGFTSGETALIDLPYRSTAERKK